MTRLAACPSGPVARSGLSVRRPRHANRPTTSTGADDQAQDEISYVRAAPEEGQANECQSHGKARQPAHGSDRAMVGTAAGISEIRA